MRTATVAVTVVLVAMVGNRLSKPTIYEYQGKEIDEWFEDYVKARIQDKSESAAHRAFYAMGTNAVPFLIGRISRDIGGSLGEKCMRLLPTSMQPSTRFQEAMVAMDMVLYIKPPRDMVKPLLAPALSEKKSAESRIARIILSSLPEGAEKGSFP